VPNKGAAMRLQLEAESYGVQFNEHYLRHNRDGSFTVTVFSDEQGPRQARCRRLRDRAHD
jgi:hypothetical protein